MSMTDNTEQVKQVISFYNETCKFGLCINVTIELNILLSPYYKLDFGSI